MFLDVILQYRSKSHGGTRESETVGQHEKFDVYVPCVACLAQLKQLSCSI